MNRSFIFIFLSALLLTACAKAPAANVSAAAGSVLFQDDFSSPLSGFDHFMSPEGVMDYDGGGYRILANALQTNFWATPRKNFSNVRMEVDSGKLGGPDENRIGLLCRYSENNYYFFIITSDGYYGAGIFFNGQALLLGQSEMQFSEVIQRGVAVNHLRADCVGAALTFYVNGAQLLSIQNDALKSGDVGMIAGTFNQPGADIVFDNFIVFQP